MATTAKKKTAQAVFQEKTESLMNGVAYWAAFYRCNPQRFAADYLNIQLKLFQKILIYVMIISTHFAYFAARGQGKTWLVALYCVIRCILFPGSKIIIASFRKEQALEVIQKIDEDFLKLHGWGSANLRAEISYISTSVNNARCDFKNGSWIKIAVASDSARHNRANIIIVDEFRLVPKTIVDTILKKFLTAPRQPGYLSLPEYKGKEEYEERNCEMYMTSAYYKEHWCYRKAQSFFVNMLDETKKYFCVGLPYQISIKEGLLSRAQVQDEMSEEDFDPTTWMMEMECLFQGESEGAFFKYDDITPRRKIKKAFYPLKIYQNHNIAIPELEPNEERVLSLDVALMSSKRRDNDAAALTIGRAYPTENFEYTDNIVYQETHEGLTTDELGLITMRMFYLYHCTQLVIDCAGAGIGVFDYIIKDQYDPEYGCTYPGLTCCNNDEMAERCKIKGAEKRIWAIKANQDFNSRAATSLRNGLQTGRVNLLVNEFECEDSIKQIRGFKQMTPVEQAMLKTPYIQTSFMINEMVNLESTITNNVVKLKERTGMRKDRYSSLMMQYYVVQQLGLKMRPNVESTEKMVQKLTSFIRPSARVSKRKEAVRA